MIDHNLGDILKACREIEVEVLPELYSKLVRALAFSTAGHVIALNPVLTGRSRAGWTLSLDRASTWEPVEGAEKYEAPDVESLLDAIQTVRLGDSVWLVNNVIYILRLVEGHSKQAPLDFPAVALDQALSELDTVPL